VETMPENKEQRIQHSRPVRTREILESVDMLTDMGMLFVPIPVHSEEEFDRLMVCLGQRINKELEHRIKEEEEND